MVFYIVIKFYSVSITFSHSFHKFYLVPTMYQAGVMVTYKDKNLKTIEGNNVISNTYLTNDLENTMSL